jgi:hypothetical protein
MFSMRHVIATGFVIAGIESLNDESLSALSLVSFDDTLWLIGGVFLHDGWPINRGRP